MSNYKTCGKSNEKNRFENRVSESWEEGERGSHGWHERLKKIENDEANLDFKEIIENQLKEKKIVEKVVVKALKNNGDLVRDAADKEKSVIVYGIKKKI